MALRILIALLILAVPLELPGCGPYLSEAVFHMRTQPEQPSDFAAGRLGILQPTYERLYQMIAYRYLSGIGLNDAEQRAILPAPLPAVAGPPVATSANTWLEARNKVPGVKPLESIDPYRQVKKEGYFDNYLNCNDDAFRTAASTLQRILPTGSAADWIAAQDQVFADCSKGTAIPQPTSDAKLRADREYQIAAARFYSEQYDAARQNFRAIAADSSSPWHTVAPYLSARCLIRAGNFTEAEVELQRLAADPAEPRLHEPATALLGYVQAHLHPAERMHELSLALRQPNSQATIRHDLTDYRRLFDKDVKPEPADDLSDWIRSFQANGAGAVEKWRANHTLPWLVGALRSARPHDAAVPDLLAAAAEVKPESPGYLTLGYERIRLLPPDEARGLTDQLLSGTLAAAARNQFRAERMRQARDFEEFLRFASRRPVAESSYEVTPLDTTDEYLDHDSTEVFDRELPLALLKQAAASNFLPSNIREDLKHVVDTRALLLSSSPPFDQVFALLMSPGLRPSVAEGFGRNTKELNKIDSFRDNWWCSLKTRDAQGSPAPDASPAEPGAPFLNAAQRAQAAAEQEMLRTVPAAPDWLAAQTLVLAQQHPTDPRAAEALSLVVRASRYGCTDEQTGDFSKRAFDLLHRRYPNSDWAKKTPFWYK